MNKIQTASVPISLAQLMMQTVPCVPVPLVELMPINCSDRMDSKAIKGVFGNYSGLVRLTRNAVRAFLDGDFPDPLVGENACQIRAAIYCHMAQDHEVIVELNKASLLFEKNASLLARVTLPGDRPGEKRRCSLLQVLEENNLNIRIPPKIMDSIVFPILFGHILTVTKLSDLTFDKGDVSLKESCDYKKLPELGAGFAKDLVKNARVALSQCSIHYLHREVHHLPLSLERDSIVEMMRAENILSDPLGLKTSPLLQGMKILLSSMKENQTPIVLKNRMIDGSDKEIGSVTLLFESKGKGHAFEVVKDLSCVDKNRPVFVVESVAVSDKTRDVEELKTSLISIGIETIILANSAAHPQYGGANKGVEPPQTQEREDLKDRAFKLGLCSLNPEVCRIYHIYAGMLKQHLLQGVTL